MTTTEAMKLALEALMRSRKAVSGDLDLAGCAYGSNDPDGHRYDDAKKALVTLDKAITALREALNASLAEQPAQKEPVAWRIRCTDPMRDWVLMYRHPRTEEQFSNMEIQPLYTSPPAQRTWVGLTRKEVHDLYDSNYAVFHQRIEAKLKENNT